MLIYLNYFSNISFSNNKDFVIYETDSFQLDKIINSIKNKLSTKKLVQ